MADILEKTRNTNHYINSGAYGAVAMGLLGLFCYYFLDKPLVRKILSLLVATQFTWIIVAIFMNVFYRHLFEMAMGGAITLIIGAFIGKPKWFSELPDEKVLSD